MSQQADSDDDIRMQRRRVTMPDGRYMYYFTFGTAGSTPSVDAEKSDAANELPEPSEGTDV